MSDAEATIRSQILTGLVKNAHITRLPSHAVEMLVEDVLAALFAPSVRWAVAEYLRVLVEQQQEETP